MQKISGYTYSGGNESCGTPLDYAIRVYYLPDVMTYTISVEVHTEDIVSMRCTHIKCTRAIAETTPRVIRSDHYYVLNGTCRLSVFIDGEFSKHLFRGLVVALARHMNLTRFISSYAHRVVGDADLCKTLDEVLPTWRRAV